MIKIVIVYTVQGNSLGSPVNKSVIYCFPAKMARIQNEKIISL